MSTVVVLAMLVIGKSVTHFSVQPREIAGMVAVPLETRRDAATLVVVGAINERPFRLMVDTGAVATCIDEKFAMQLNLPTVGFGQAVGVSGREVPVRFARLDRLKLGHGLIQSVTVCVMDMSWLNAGGIKNGSEVVGVLGNDLLAKTNAIIDYNQQILYLNLSFRQDADQFQGQWRVTSLVASGRSVDPVGMTIEVHGRKVLLRTGTNSGGKVFTGTLNINEHGGTYYICDIEYLHPPKKPLNLFGLQIVLNDPELMPIFGRYEITRNRLRLTMPQFDGKERPAQPPSDFKSTLDNGLLVATFGRVPDAGRRPMLGGLAMLLPGVMPPVRLGGWEFAVTPDWALVGSHAARKVRFTARLDGSVLFQPVRP